MNSVSFSKKPKQTYFIECLQVTLGSLNFLKKPGSRPLTVVNEIRLKIIFTSQFLFETLFLLNKLACQSYSTDYIHNGQLAKDGEIPWMVFYIFLVVFLLYSIHFSIHVRLNNLGCFGIYQ